MARSSTLAEKLSRPMTAGQLRAVLFAAKEEGRARRAARPVSEKMAALEVMRRIAAPIRAARSHVRATKAKD